MTGEPSVSAPGQGCTCPHPWHSLTTVIEGITHGVVPAPAHTPALYLAHCTGCGALYTGPWKRLNSFFHAA
ncbi:hypothetical protein ABZ471_37630 [Streptomyces sp. NPDC005728]|uniref:hypothetical protein n=1 Tax=Streptomyces sp. NPDC005728 TaxID=3157054 RepID=UPI0033D19A34